MKVSALDRTLAADTSRSAPMPLPAATTPARESASSTPPLIQVHGQQMAMGTIFEAWLVGQNTEHLQAVLEAAFDEIQRLEQLLSFYDRTSELSRVNRESLGNPLRVDRELWSILYDCQLWHHRTNGFFDIRLFTTEVSPEQRQDYTQTVRLDPMRRTVELCVPGLQLDLGGYGKGLALDRVKALLLEFAIASAMWHGGTSSILAWGEDTQEQPWQVRLQTGSKLDADCWQLRLCNVGLSCSAVFGHPFPTSAPKENQASDIRDPHTGKPLTVPAACWVIADTALEAEVLSTALLAMGQERAKVWLPYYRLQNPPSKPFNPAVANYESTASKEWNFQPVPALRIAWWQAPMLNDTTAPASFANSFNALSRSVTASQLEWWN